MTTRGRSRRTEACTEALVASVVTCPVSLATMKSLRLSTQRVRAQVSGSWRDIQRSRGPVCSGEGRRPATAVPRGCGRAPRPRPRRVGPATGWRAPSARARRRPAPGPSWQATPRAAGAPAPSVTPRISAARSAHSAWASSTQRSPASCGWHGIRATDSTSPVSETALTRAADVPTSTARTWSARDAMLRASVPLG